MRSVHTASREFNSEFEVKEEWRELLLRRCGMRRNETRQSSNSRRECRPLIVLCVLHPLVASLSCR